MSHQLAFCLVSEKLQVWKLSLISAGARCSPRLCPSNSWWSCIAMLVLNYLFLLNLIQFLLLSLPFWPQPLLEEKKPILTSNLCVAVFGAVCELPLPHPTWGRWVTARRDRGASQQLGCSRCACCQHPALFGAMSSSVHGWFELPISALNYMLQILFVFSAYFIFAVIYVQLLVWL